MSAVILYNFVKDFIQEVVNMPRNKKAVIEYRHYDLPVSFPILVLSGEKWRISDIPSGRLHFHNCLEIGICESDYGTIEFMDDRVSFQTGDVSIIASNIAHTTYSAPGTASKWSYIFVDIEELFRPFFPLNILENGDIIIRLLNNFSAVLPYTVYPEISRLVYDILKEIKHEEINYRISVRGMCLTLVTKLLQIYSCRDKDSIIHTHGNSLVITPALNYIHKNFMQQFSMNYLAELCHLSPTHFRRIFTSVMGDSPLEYLNHYRIQKASVLLRTTERTILSVSEEVGFRSLSSFNRHFSADFNTTPKEWRRKMSATPNNNSVLQYQGWIAPPKSLH